MRVQFTKDAATEAMSSVSEMHEALSRGKQMVFMEHLKQVLLFLEAARSAAPTIVPRPFDPIRDVPGTGNGC